MYLTCIIGEDKRIKEKVSRNVGILGRVDPNPGLER